MSEQREFCDNERCSMHSVRISRNQGDGLYVSAGEIVRRVMVDGRLFCEQCAPAAARKGPAMTLPPLPELPTLDCTNTARVLFVRWATQYGQDCAKAAVESCRKLCDDYSKHLIATGEPSTPSEWEAHGAESCANLIGGLSEYGDPPESEHFAGTYAAIRAAKQGEQG